MSTFLKSIDIERYGALSHRRIGPFEQGLNVVFGPNEAGKSTVASFVGGVLFGWDEAHGVQNTYSPETGSRSGSLVFADGSQISRSRNADGAQGSMEVVNDLDSATFKTMFFLTSDELRSLRNSSDVTAQLLTAGSGTGSSPAAAFVEIEQRIAALTSRAPGADGSLFNLSDELDAERERVKSIGEETEERKRESRELRALREDREITARHLSDVTRGLDKLHSCRTRVEHLDNLIDSGKREVAALESERREFIESAAEFDSVNPKLLQLDSAAERSLRDRLDEYADEQAKAARGADIAKENASASAAAYEALVEMDAEAAKSRSTRRSKSSLAIPPAFLAVAFAAAGIPVFIHARNINSLSLTALGIGLVVFACLLAVTTVVLVARPDKSAEALESRQQDAQWVMLQDRKKLDTSLAAKRLLDDEVTAFLDEAGLGAANGSVRQARALLDDAREKRSAEQARRQRVASLNLRIASARTSLDELQAERSQVMELSGVDAGTDLDAVDAEIELKTSQRQALAATCDGMSLRIGELTERLDNAVHDRTFDFAKLEYHQTRTRLRDAKHELITLLLAKRMLEKSIAAWESRNQPEVFRKASSLFATMTNNAWNQVSMTAEGTLVATSPSGTVREVRHLSLGTCQQLFLSLRIAMLLNAGHVGSAVPVLADDILVNFDAGRRAGAAQALAELAEKRQVIVFTCHRETLAALRDAQPNLNCLELQAQSLAGDRDGPAGA